DGDITLTLELPDAAVPTEVATSPRHIALAVQSLVISSLVAPRQTVPRLTSEISLTAPDEKDLLSAAQATTGLPPATLAARFENLVGNCEFGFFQRKCGAEPLSL